MKDSSIAYRQLLAYIDDLNVAIGSLAGAVEEQIRSRGYAPIAKAGNQCYWYLSSSMDRPQGWRLKMVTRVLVPYQEDQGLYPEPA